jgi:hypothetical protein
MNRSFDAQHLIAGLDPGRSKCGLVLADRLAQQIPRLLSERAGQ